MPEAKFKVNVKFRNKQTYDVSIFVVADNDIPFHLYADDTQLYLSFGTNDSQSNLDRLSLTLDKVYSWFTENRLTLNASKTEFLIIGNRQQRSKLAPLSV